MAKSTKRGNIQLLSEELESLDQEGHWPGEKIVAAASASPRLNTAHPVMEFTLRASLQTFHCNIKLAGLLEIII